MAEYGRDYSFNNVNAIKAITAFSLHQIVRWNCLIWIVKNMVISPPYSVFGRDGSLSLVCIITEIFCKK
jgi:hypothetical protein